jgi:hypothetical protein
MKHLRVDSNNIVYGGWTRTFTHDEELQLGERVIVSDYAEAADFEAVVKVCDEHMTAVAIDWNTLSRWV